MKILLVLQLIIVYCLLLLPVTATANHGQINNNLSMATISGSELSVGKVSQDKIKLCAVYPHLKDSYWLSINFGMTEQAKQRSIELGDQED